MTEVNVAIEDDELTQALSVRAALRTEHKYLHEIGQYFAAGSLRDYVMHADPASVLRLRAAIAKATAS